MSGECDKCGEHTLKCICKRRQQKASKYNDDHIIADIVTQCLHVMRSYPTLTKMTACYNLVERILRLFSVQGSKEDVKGLMNEFHKNIMQSVEEYYE